jgi:hypothetical protein
MNTENKITEKRIPVLVKKAERIKNTAIYVDGEIGEVLEGNYNVGRIVKRIIMEMRRELKDFQVLVNEKIKKLKELKTDEPVLEKKSAIKEKPKKEVPIAEENKIEIDPDLKWLAEYLSIDIQDLKQKEIIKLIKEELGGWSDDDFEENATKKFNRITKHFKLIPEKQEEEAEEEIEEEPEPEKEIPKKKINKAESKSKSAKSKSKKEAEEFEEDDDDKDFEEGEEAEAEGEAEGDDF